MIEYEKAALKNCIHETPWFDNLAYGGALRGAALSKVRPAN